LGFLAVAACGESSQGGGPAGTSSTGTQATGSGGSATSTGAAGSGTGTLTTGNGTGGASTGPGTGGSTSTGSGGTGGSVGSGGAADSGATGGSGMTDGGGGGPPMGGCSEPGAGPTPPAGFMKQTAPIDMKFPFTTHWMGTFSDTSKCISMTSLTDIDKDGDQDFADGQRDPMSSCGTAGAPMIWWEYCSPDHWVKHTVGTGYHSAASGGAGDFDGDGWIDLVAGDSWFKNPGANVRTAGAWTRYNTGAPPIVEEITVGDLTNDGKLDVVYVERTIDPQWGNPGTNPTQPWTIAHLSAYRQQQGGSIGDLDGDGWADIAVGDRWWYKNPGMAGGMFTPMPIPANATFAPGAGANGSEPITMMADIDGDGDNDIAMHTHWGGNIAWMENRDGKGTMWVAHTLAPGMFQAKTNLHGILLADFDNDGDVDMFIAQNQGNIWIYENTDGKGTFAEHLVATGPGHEARVADVDCDGDLDVVGKPWGNIAEGRGEVTDDRLRAHVYFKNELVERGGKAVFDRPKFEVWNVPNKGRCK
jgi:hypothetical protein